ncbi:TPA: DcrB-related protein [Pseudomonas putida]|nr:DcrB-related protein [Pseudomonas putida]
MIKGNIYDRLSQRREAAQALAKEEAERQAAAEAALQAATLAELAQPLPLVADHNELHAAGLRLVMPQGLNLHESTTTLQLGPHQVTLTTKRQSVAQGQTLDHLLEQHLAEARQRHTEVTLIRKHPCTLAGHDALNLDYRFTNGPEARHCRAVMILVPERVGQEAQALTLTTVVDPDQEPLANWLITFDAMLANITSAPAVARG